VKSWKTTLEQQMLNQRDQPVVEAAVEILRNSALPRRRIPATMSMPCASIVAMVEEGPSYCCPDLSLYWRY
jgi:hypothetical protein